MVFLKYFFEHVNFEKLPADEIVGPDTDKHQASWADQEGEGRAGGPDPSEKNTLI